MMRDTVVKLRWLKCKKMAGIHNIQSKLYVALFVQQNTTQSAPQRLKEITLKLSFGGSAWKVCVAQTKEVQVLFIMHLTFQYIQN